MGGQAGELGRENRRGMGENGLDDHGQGGSNQPVQYLPIKEPPQGQSVHGSRRLAKDGQTAKADHKAHRGQKCTTRALGQ